MEVELSFVVVAEVHKLNVVLEVHFNSEQVAAVNSKGHTMINEVVAEEVAAEDSDGRTTINHSGTGILQS